MNRYQKTSESLRRLCLATMFLSMAGMSVNAKNALLLASPESVNWPTIKASLFKDNPEINTNSIVKLVIPSRGEDPAAVPVKIALREGSNLDVKKIYLIIDNNPSPVAAVLTVMQANKFVAFTTKVRINDYGEVRAIVETSDGKLYMDSHYVKATSGCTSAPLSNDNGAGKLSETGNMKLSYTKKNGIMSADLLISHPNNSGLQIDPLSRNWIPADYVNKIKLMIDDKELVSFVGGISISENPALHFYFKSDMQGEIKVVAGDSTGREFREHQTIKSR